MIEPNECDPARALRLRPAPAQQGRRVRLGPALRLAGAGIALVAALGTGCSSAYYRGAADRAVYGILSEKELAILGHTNAFTIDTPYSARAPKDIPAAELIAGRVRTGEQIVTLEDALRLAFANNRQYQFRKETLYLAALTLTTERHEFEKQPVALFNTSLNRASDKSVTGNGDGQLSVAQLLQTGGTVSASLVSDMLRYFSLTDSPGRSILTTLSLKFTQPLLRGAGVEVVAENLKQAERDVIYGIRSYSHFQKSFAVEIVTTYFRLLQRKDIVRNSYANYLNLVKARERAEALAQDRLPAFQADQARQDELRAKSTYINAAQAFRAELDQFKQTLTLPVGTAIFLEDTALQSLTQTGLLPINLNDTRAYELAVSQRADLLNNIDQFEDAKRKLTVAASQLKMGLTFIADAGLTSDAVDYAKFDFSRFRASAGLGLDLPLDRVRQRNLYRATILNFERQLRVLAAALDAARDSLRQSVRILEQVRENHVIQQNALELANKRVESAELLLQAGRAQIRDQLEAQTALVAAQNAVTEAVVDYHAARWKLLLDTGLLQTDRARWWLEPQGPAPGPNTPPPPKPGQEVVAPEKLFGK